MQADGENGMAEQAKVHAVGPTGGGSEAPMWQNILDHVAVGTSGCFIT